MRGQLPAPARRLLALALLAGCSSLACSPRPSPHAGRRLVILGIDGLDPKMVRRHLEVLPGFRRLAAMSGLIELGTTNPPQSPTAWSTVATGLDPGSHGIFDFILRDPQTMELYSSMARTEEARWSLRLGDHVLPLSQPEVLSLRRGRVFWSFLEEAGVPAILTRMPTNFPPVPGSTLSLAGMGTPDMLGTLGTFSFFTDDPHLRAGAVSGGRVYRVVLHRGRLSTTLEGPPNSFRRDQRPVAVPLTVTVDAERRAALVELGDQSTVLREGEWSPWLRVSFEAMPLLMSASGVVRVLVQQVHPHLRLYLSPVNIDPADPQLPLTSPPGYAKELHDRLGPFYSQSMPEDTAAYQARIFSREDFLRQARLVLHESIRMYWQQLADHRQGLFFYYFSTVDLASHLLFHRHEPELLSIYQELDAVVTRTLERLDPETTLIVMSDHGFTYLPRKVNLNRWLAREGFLAFASGAGGAGEDRSFADIDWTRTRAYAVGFNGLYLNRKGRERQGQLDPGAAEQLKRQLRERLLGLYDDDYGKRVVEEVFDPAVAYPGSPPAAIPDLVVGYAPPFRPSDANALGAAPPRVFEEDTSGWVGDHLIAPRFIPGTLLSNRKIVVERPTLYDIPVTILGHYGIPPGPGMKGRDLLGKR